MSPELVEAAWALARAKANPNRSNIVALGRALLRASRNYDDYDNYEELALMEAGEMCLAGSSFALELAENALEDARAS